MDDLYNNLKIYETEVKGSSENIAFVSSNITGSTNDAVKTAYGVSAANSKANASTLPNVDSLRMLEDGLEVVGGNADNESKEISQEDWKESRDPKHQDNRTREITRRTVPVEENTSNALVSQCDGFGYDWSDQAEEGPTNFTLMAYTTSGSSSSSSSDTEARLGVYKKNEVVFEEDIKILKLDIMLRDKALTELRKKFEKAEKERDDLKLTLEKFENSSKNLSKLLDSQVSDKFKSDVGYDSQVFDSQVFDSHVNDKYKTGEGYYVVPPPYTGNFMPPKPDLVLDDKDKNVFSESVTSVPAVATNEVKTSESKPKSVSEPLIKDWISNSENKNETESKSKKRKPSNTKVEFVKSNEHVKSPRESVKKVENNKQAKYLWKNSQSPRDYDFYEKKMVEKPVWNNAIRVNHHNSQRMSHLYPKGNFVPRAVLMKSGLKTLNTARQNSSRAAVSVNTARPINTVQPRKAVNNAGPMKNVITNAYPTARRPFNKITGTKNSNFNQGTSIVKDENVNTFRPKVVVNTAMPKTVLNAVKGNKGNVVKASAYMKDKGVIDSGCSRNMTGNRSYLIDYEDIDRGFVALGGSTKGGKITRKGKIRTGKLDFEDVYFVKELKFNLLSVLQMCDKNNSVLFTDTECVVLSSDFKLTDESHVLLKVPRKDNMYSVDLKNVVP
ncbi:hypothetical protein Tco_0255358 [Tanacetum coccineum]